MASEIDSEGVSLEIGEGKDAAEDGDASVMESDFSDDNPVPPAVNDEDGQDEDRRKSKRSPRGKESEPEEEESLVPVRSTAKPHEDGARDTEAAEKIIKTEPGTGGGQKGIHT